MKYDINEINRCKEQILRDLRRLKAENPESSYIPIDKYPSSTARMAIDFLADEGRIRIIDNYGDGEGVPLVEICEDANEVDEK